MLRQPWHRKVCRAADDESHHFMANALVDELVTDGDGNFEVVLSADEHDGNWMPIDGAHLMLTVRHFFYDWDTETPLLRIERIGDGAG